MNFNLVFLSYDLNWMAEYLTILDRAFEARKAEFEEYMDTQTVDMSQEEREEYLEFYADDYSTYVHDLPRFSRQSFVITWLAFVEDEFLKLCNQLGVNIYVQDKKGKEQINMEQTKKSKKRINLEQAKELLEKRTHYPIDYQQWNELKNIKYLRNAIVHNGGRLNFSAKKIDSYSTEYTDRIGTVVFIHNSDKESVDYLDSHSLLNNSVLSPISPTSEYCSHLVKFAHEFFDKLYKDLETELVGAFRSWATSDWDTE